MSAPTSALCSCGSGLRAVRCCGMQQHTLSPPEAIRHLVPLVERASRAHRQGATETAERLCLDVLELAPDRPGALSILYEIRKAEGKAQAAQALIQWLASPAAYSAIKKSGLEPAISLTR